MLPLYDNIRRRRIELNMSQQELAEKAGYTDRSSIAKIETGKVDLTQSKIIAIASALKIKPGQLMGWTEPDNQALWRYLTIKDGKLYLEFHGLCHPRELQNVIEKEKNSPLPFDISPHIFSVLDKNESLSFALWDGDSELTEEKYKELEALIRYIKSQYQMNNQDVTQLDQELIHRLCSLNEDELARVDAFVQGLLANRST